MVNGMISTRLKIGLVFTTPLNRIALNGKSCMGFGRFDSYTEHVKKNKHKVTEERTRDLTQRFLIGLGVLFSLFWIAFAIAYFM